ncbi:MAG: hypothetical protein LUI07_10160, partial [Lachnospiraceae bacterium]|nr:hypothetical protein [Lachnospiraceae bacterium]
MNMNYFRLLFSRWGECLVHFGEWKDTRTGDKFTFLYLGAKQEPVSQKPVNQKNEGSGHTLFLCPKYVDFLVLGEKNEAVLSIAREIVRETAVGTLVYPGGMEVSETAGAAGETEEPDKPEYDLSETARTAGGTEKPDESECDSSEIAGADGGTENPDESE